MIFRRVIYLSVVLVSMSSFGVETAIAEEKAVAELPPPSSDPVKPVPRDRDYPWMSLAFWQGAHAANSAEAAKGEAELIFLGDSITQMTQWSENWKKTFEGYRYLNFGIGGDRTQNVLWRLENGEVGKLKPKVVVLLIGTNNLGTTTNDLVDVPRGVTAIVKKLRDGFPQAKVLVLGIFPRDEKSDAPVRATIGKINAELKKLDDGKTVFVRDIGKVFLEPDGTLSTTVSQDHLHLTEEGNRRWAETLAPLVRELMR
ncbi:MAG: GDSL-type esterase/lipase family protein [Nibricoccus sp.]